MCLPGYFEKCGNSSRNVQHRQKSAYCHPCKAEGFQMGLRCCVWPAGHLNAGSVGEAGQRSWAQVSLQWGHMPFEGISSAMCGSLSRGGEGWLSRRVYPGNNVCLHAYICGKVSFLRYEFAALFKRNLGVCGRVGLILCMHFLKRTKTQRIAVIAGMFNRGPNTSCLSVCIIKLRFNMVTYRPRCFPPMTYFLQYSMTLCYDFGPWNCHFGFCCAFLLSCINPKHLKL